jgi:chorismate synthase
MSSSFGTLFRVTTFGESHGQGVGAVIDGCPPKTPLDETDIQPQLDRRRPAQSKLTTPRKEADRVSILSGVQNGKTLGTPIALMVKNTDQRPADYHQMRSVPRPSHADYTYQMKYGIRALSGGGRSSARETVGRVAAGAIAEKFLSERYGIEIVAWVSSVSTIDAPSPDMTRVTRKDVDGSMVRCPDSQTAEKMTAAIEEAQQAGDSLGGIITCVCRNIPTGLGEPVFNKLEAFNDVFIKKGTHLGTRTNYSGGVQGGISNGEPLIFRVAFKPPATISMPQKTVDFEGNDTVLEAKGRHDPCVVPRAVPIVESMAALVVADLALQQKMRENETV